MSAALILYGSRARGEARPGSDLDLIYAQEGTSIGPPKNSRGVSIHFYSKGWLEKESRRGSLFAYHVAFEGFALHDPSKFVLNLRKHFVKKNSYRNEQEEALLVLRMLLESDWRDNIEARRRYFWAIRTILICQSAHAGVPKFSSNSLERISNLPGLANHIDSRDTVSFAECRQFGGMILNAHGVGLRPQLHGNALRDYLLQLGGIACDSVRVVEEREAIESSGLQIYL